MLKKIIKSILNLCFRVRMQGELPETEGRRTLVVANHESFLDGLVLGLNLPFDATFVVHSQVVQHPLMGRMLRFVDHLAVDPANPMAIKQIIRLVESGRPVVIFPEGRITTTGSLMKIYDGAGFIAARTGAQVVPVRLDGPARSYFSRLGQLMPRQFFPRITLNVSPVRSIDFPPISGSAHERRRRAGEAMRRILLDMLVSTAPAKTLFSAFLDARDTFGAGHRFIEDVRQVEESYGSMTKMTLGIQHMMKTRTEPREIVGLLMPNAAPTLAMILGLTSIGRVPAMLNYTAGREGLESACTAAGIRKIFASRAFLEKGNLTGLVEGLNLDVEVLYLEDLKAAFGLKDKLQVAIKLPFARQTQDSQCRPEDPAAVIFTSGSEGKPKGVVHTHASLLANVTQIRAVADFTPNDKFMMALPLFHSFGLTCGALMPLVSGCKVFLYPTPLHYRIIPEIVYDRNCTVLFGTSTFLAKYARFAHPYDFGRLRYVVAGAEKLSEAVRKTWIDRFGIRILEGYGVSECAPVVAVNTPMAAKPGSVGPLLPMIEYALDPVPGLEMPAGTQKGILRVRGPNVMAGYLRFEKPGVIEPPEHDQMPGWYCTGDVVRIDEEGYVFIEGRVKRFSKIAGEMVSLDVVEKLATQASPRGQHAVVARPDAAKGEALILFTTDSLLDRAQLSDVARNLGLSELNVPRTICLLEQIPVLGSGKTDYVRLNALAREGRAS